VMTTTPPSSSEKLGFPQSTVFNHSFHWNDC
jgi:hypothetical protein